MNIPLSNQNDIFSYGFDRYFNRIDADGQNKSAYDPVSDPTAPQYSSQSLVTLQGSSIIQSGNYSSGLRGYRIDSSGDLEIGNIIFNRDVVMTWFESIDGLTVASTGSATAAIRLGDLQLTTGTTANSQVTVDNENLSSLPSKFGTKDSIFTTTVSIPKLTGSTYIAHFAVGDFLSGAGVNEGYGFKVYSDVLTAMYSVAGVESTLIITGIETGNTNTYMAKNDVKKREVSYYVNKQLKAVRPVVFTNTSTEFRFSMNMRNIAATNRQLGIVNAVFAQDK